MQEGELLLQKIAHSAGIISHAFTETKDTLQSNSAGMQQTSAQFEHVQQQLLHVLHISEENTAATEEMIGSLLSQNELIVAITDSTSQLHDLSGTLREVSKG